MHATAGIVDVKPYQNELTEIIHVYMHILKDCILQTLRVYIHIHMNTAEKRLRTAARAKL